MIDKDLDKHVERTKDRPLVTKKISMGQAYAFLTANITGGLLVLSLLNLKTWVYAFLCFPTVVLYPFCKRFMSQP